VSLYCFVIALASDVKLLNESLRRGSLSGCDEFDVFTPDLLLAQDLPGVPITVVDVAAGTSRDVRTADLGLKVYTAIHTKGRFREHNLVVQLDVTTIFSPLRMRRIFAQEVLSQPKFWCTNRWRNVKQFVPESQAKLHHSVVVLTPSAFDLFGTQGKSVCGTASGQTTKFLFRCLSNLNVTHVHAELTRIDDQGVQDVGQHCAYADIPAFAERHSPAGFGECWAQMRLADLAQESRCDDLPSSGDARRCCTALHAARSPT